MMSNKIENFIRPYNIRSITEIDRGKINANAIIIKYRDMFEIYIDKDLPFYVKNFTIFHEIGHIALGFITNNPQENFSQDIEDSINLWAFKHFEYLLPANIDRQIIIKCFLESEAKAFEMISNIKE